MSVRAEQGTLFDPNPDPPWQRHSETSKASAKAIKPTSETLRDKVRELLKARDIYGATDEEMQQCIPMDANTQRPRRRELEKSGEVVDSGRKRETKSKRMAVVWVLREFKR